MPNKYGPPWWCLVQMLEQWTLSTRQYDKFKQKKQLEDNIQAALQNYKDRPKRYWPEIDNVMVLYCDNIGTVLVSQYNSRKKEDLCIRDLREKIKGRSVC